MTSEADICNRALAAIGTRSQIASLTENSNEAINCNLLYHALRDELIRLAPWNCATNYQTLTLLLAAPGTPENPATGGTHWSKGTQPPPPWAYEYAYPSDCLKPLWVVPQFTTGFASGIPITTATTGGVPAYWQGPPVRYKVGVDQDLNGNDIKVILTNQEDAILAYCRRVTNPDVWDSQFDQAVVAALAGRLAIPLTGDKALANLKIQEANAFIVTARQGDGNEGLTINDVTPDWIRVRGISYANDYGWSPNIIFDWGPMLSAY